MVQPTLEISVILHSKIFQSFHVIQFSWSTQEFSVILSFKQHKKSVLLYASKKNLNYSLDD